MESKQRKNMLWRIPLVVAILMAIFWGIWYLSSGEIPTTTQIKWTEETAVQLPFSISRLWDIPFAFIWAFILVFLFTHKKIKDDEDLGIGLAAGLISGLVVGLGVGLGAGLVAGLEAGLAFGLAASLVFGLAAGLGVGLGASLGVGLVVGLVVDLAVGLAFGLVFGLAAVLAAVLAANLVLGLKLIFSKSVWKKIGQWFQSTGQWIVGK